MPDLSKLPHVYVLPIRLDDSQRKEIISNLKSARCRIAATPRDASIFIGDILGAKRAALELRFLGLPTTDVTSVKSTTPQDGKILQVVKLSWYKKATSSDSNVNINDFTVYRGLFNPSNPATVTVSSPITPKKRSSSPPSLAEQQELDLARRKSIMRRAMAVTHPVTPGTRHLRNHHHSQDAPTSQFKRPKLLSQESTDSHDESEETLASLPPFPDWVVEKQKFSCTRSTPSTPHNKDFVEALFKIRLNRLIISDEIGVRAYSTAIAAISAFPHPITHISQIRALPGCDDKIAALWYEFQHSDPPGQLEVLTEITTSKYYKTLELFYNIWGCGAHSARNFYKQGFRDLDDLVEHHWKHLTRVQQIGVKFYDEFENKIPRDEVVAIRDRVQFYARQLLPGAEAVIVGGFRRGKELSNDVDILITHPRVSKSRDVEELLVPLVDLLEEKGLITHVLTIHQPSKFVANTDGEVWGKRSHHNFDGIPKILGVWQEPDEGDDEDEDGDSQMKEAGDENSDPKVIRTKRKNRNPHRRVDILFPPPRCAGSTLTSWSGATTFERDLRRYVKAERYWKFSSEGITNRATGTRVPVGKEKGEFIGLTEEEEKAGLEIDDDVEKRGRKKDGEWIGWEIEERKLFKVLGLQWREPTERCTG
ncbi:hypothetical protein H072_8085 [Dactylellina haptotyla CBS 200.50]|uniref:DNA polymerase n=1 Tax=Dactylellina haptotyla (strain CBS 200.50) TaxID=1284197 RepID=S8A5W2_DACHA|nr:hypothetical protein H072_8085 [Dactylellina haptotyla CBS 200.50]